MRRFLCLSLAAIALTGASRALPIHHVRPADAEKLLYQGGVLLLDVRTPEEFRSGHIPSARLFPILGMTDRLKELPSDKTQPVLVYCTVGVRSIKAAKILARYGYKDIYNLSGGLNAWAAEQRPIEKPSAPPAAHP